MRRLYCLILCLAVKLTAQSTPSPVLLASMASGVPVPIASSASTGQLQYTPPMVLAKCQNGQLIVDCVFSGGASLPPSTAANQVPLYTTSGSTSPTPTTLTPTLVGASDRVLGNLTSLSAAQTNLGVGLHLNAYVPIANVSPGGCTTNASLCNNQTTQVQAWLDAGQLLGQANILDSAGPGSCYAITQVHFYRGTKFQADPFLYAGGGAFCKIPGSPSTSPMVSDPTLPGSSYLDGLDLGGFAISLPPTDPSPAITVNSRLGELAKIHDISIGPGGGDGILLTRGADPAVIDNVGGYQLGGSALHLMKTGGDPWNRIVLDRIAADNTGTGAIHLQTGSGPYSADQFIIGSVKVETRMDNTAVPTGTPEAVWADNLNGTPVTIGALNFVQVGASSAMGTTTASSCNGTTCSLSFSISAGFVPPATGDLVGVNSTSVSGYNTQTCATTATTATTITCTATTTASNGTATGGTAYWNRKTTGGVRITGSTTPVSIGSYMAEGGTNNQGSFGYSTIVDDEANSYTVLNTDIQGNNASTGVGLVSGVYTASRTFSYNGTYFVNADSSSFNGQQFWIRGDSFPRLRVTPNYGTCLGSGSSDTDACLQRTGPAEMAVTQPNVQYGGMQLAWVAASQIYSASSALPSCNGSIKGRRSVVSDAASPTYMGAYTSGGAITAEVICSYNGTTYSWLTH